MQLPVGICLGRWRGRLLVVIHFCLKSSFWGTCNVMDGQYCDRVDGYPLIPASWRRYGMFYSLDDQGSQESEYFVALLPCLARREKG
jgi:hypothetical protein